MDTNSSPNFAFLAHHDTRLVALGTQAEQHFATDANVNDVLRQWLTIALRA